MLVQIVEKAFQCGAQMTMCTQSLMSGTDQVVVVRDKSSVIAIMVLPALHRLAAERENCVQASIRISGGTTAGLGRTEGSAHLFSRCLSGRMTAPAVGSVGRTHVDIAFPWHMIAKSVVSMSRCWTIAFASNLTCRATSSRDRA